MVTRRVLIPIFGWTLCAAILAAGGIGIWGGKAGIANQSLSVASHCGLIAWTMVAFPFLVALYQRDADAVHGRFKMIEARKRDYQGWWLRGAFSVTIASAFVWYAGYGCLARMSTYLSGGESLQAAVVSVPHDDRVSRKCHGIRVRLQDGSEEWICAKLAWGAWVPASARCAKVGDAAQVAINSNSIGTSVRLISIEAPDC